MRPRVEGSEKNESLDALTRRSTQSRLRSEYLLLRQHLVEVELRAVTAEQLASRDGVGDRARSTIARLPAHHRPLPSPEGVVLVSCDDQLKAIARQAGEAVGAANSGAQWIVGAVSRIWVVWFRFRTESSGRGPLSSSATTRETAESLASASGKLARGVCMPPSGRWMGETASPGGSDRARTSDTRPRGFR